jgi:hypothetical protein
MTPQEQQELLFCLEKDVYSIDIVAQHIRQLVEHDKLSLPLSMESVHIVGARYNRGTELSLEQIKQDLSYGKAIVKRWNRFTRLLQGIAPEGTRSWKCSFAFCRISTPLSPTLAGCTDSS